MEKKTVEIGFRINFFTSGSPGNQNYFFGNIYSTGKFIRLRVANSGIRYYIDIVDENDTFQQVGDFNNVQTGDRSKFYLYRIRVDLVTKIISFYLDNVLVGTSSAYSSTILPSNWGLGLGVSSSSSIQNAFEGTIDLTNFWVDLDGTRIWGCRTIT